MQAQLKNEGASRQQTWFGKLVVGKDVPGGFASVLTK
jgi:hypothetical protein